MSSSPSAAADAGARSPFDFAQLKPPAQSELPPRLDEAAARAGAIIAEAQAEAARVREQARATGFEEGFAAGQATARAQLQPASAALGEALAGLRELKERAASSVERHAVDLAVEIAGKVVAGTMEVQPERVLDVVRGALHAIVERDRVVIQVNPDDLELVRASVADLVASLGGIEQLDVQQERRVARGGAVLRTAVGEVDARIATKLDKARAAVESELGG